jgi:hypothetical protein
MPWILDRRNDFLRIYFRRGEMLSPVNREIQFLIAGVRQLTDNPYVDNHGNQKVNQIGYPNNQFIIFTS